MDAYEGVLGRLFARSAGAGTRVRVVLAIRRQPRNALQIAEALGLDYTTVRHHLRILERSGLLAVAGDRYGRVYFVSSAMESRWDVFERVAAGGHPGGDAGPGIRLPSG